MVIFYFCGPGRLSHGYAHRRIPCTHVLIGIFGEDFCTDENEERSGYMTSCWNHNRQSNLLCKGDFTFAFSELPSMFGNRLRHRRKKATNMNTTFETIYQDNWLQESKSEESKTKQNIQGINHNPPFTEEKNVLWMGPFSLTFDFSLTSFPASPFTSSSGSRFICMPLSSLASSSFSFVTR